MRCGVLRLVGPSSYIGVLTLGKFGFERYVLSHEMETPTFSKLGFILKISLKLNYVPA